jgi:hypothetical protein
VIVSSTDLYFKVNHLNVHSLGTCKVKIGFVLLDYFACPDSTATFVLEN